jgi:ABC-type branched-subunit amino acid transport system permease subunit
MEIERAREDLVVAASAGATTVALALLSGGAGLLDLSTVPTLAPLAVYAAYLFSRKGGPYGSLDRPRNWAAVAVLAGGLVAVASALLA